MQVSISYAFCVCVCAAMLKQETLEVGFCLTLLNDGDICWVLMAASKGYQLDIHSRAAAINVCHSE